MVNISTTLNHATRAGESDMSDAVKNAEALQPLLALIEDALGHIEFGSVELIFHHGKLVQLEKHEKVRFDKN